MMSALPPGAYAWCIDQESSLAKITHAWNTGPTGSQSHLHYTAAHTHTHTHDLPCSYCTTATDQQAAVHPTQPAGTQHRQVGLRQEMGELSHQARGTAGHLVTDDCRSGAYAWCIEQESSPANNARTSRSPHGS